MFSAGYSTKLQSLIENKSPTRQQFHIGVVVDETDPNMLKALKGMEDVFNDTKVDIKILSFTYEEIPASGQLAYSKKDINWKQQAINEDIALFLHHYYQYVLVLFQDPKKHINLIIEHVQSQCIIAHKNLQQKIKWNILIDAKQDDHQQFFTEVLKLI